MWNACLIGLKLGDWLGHSRILHFLPSKTLGLLLLCVLGQRPFLLWSVINFAPFDWIWAEYIPPLQNSSGCFCPLSYHHKTPVTQCHWKPGMLMPSHCSTMFHRCCCVLWIMSCSKLSPYFFLPVILAQVDLNFICPKNTFWDVFFGKV